MAEKRHRGDKMRKPAILLAFLPTVFWFDAPLLVTLTRRVEHKISYLRPARRLQLPAAMRQATGMTAAFRATSQKHNAGPKPARGTAVPDVVRRKLCPTKRHEYSAWRDMCPCQERQGFIVGDRL